MRYIQVESCSVCPYRQNGLFGKTSMCSKTSLEIKNCETFPHSCPLKTLDIKKSKSEVTEAMRSFVVSAYQQYRVHCPSLPKENAIDDKLVKSTYLTIVKHADEIEKALKLVNGSDFLCGRTGNSWKADFKWIFQVGHKGSQWNIDKILTGRYSGESNKTSAFQDGVKHNYGAWKK